MDCTHTHTHTSDCYTRTTKEVGKHEVDGLESLEISIGLTAETVFISCHYFTTKKW